MSLAAVLQQQQRRNIPGIIPAGHFTAEQVAVALGSPAANVAETWPLVVKALRQFGIDDRPTEIAAIATIGVEAHDFVPVREAYWLSEAWRRANLRYYPWYGRGLVQTTWQENYERVRDVTGIDCVSDPDKLLEPWPAALALALFLSDHGLSAMANAGDWRGIRRAVNGGDAGLADFLGYVQALQAL